VLSEQAMLLKTLAASVMPVLKSCNAVHVMCLIERRQILPYISITAATLALKA
jgi:hypothetical protein